MLSFSGFYLGLLPGKFLFERIFIKVRLLDFAIFSVFRYLLFIFDFGPSGRSPLLFRCYLPLTVSRESLIIVCCRLFVLLVHWTVLDCAFFIILGVDVLYVKVSFFAGTRPRILSRVLHSFLSLVCCVQEATVVLFIFEFLFSQLMF